MPLIRPFKVVPKNIRDWSKWFATLQVVPDNESTDTEQLADDAVTTVKIPDDAVTLAKIQNIATSRILGRLTAASGVIEELTAAQAADILEATDWIFTGEVKLNGTVGLFSVTPTAQIANIPDADVAHSLTDADGDLGAATQAEIEGVFDALGAKINALISALETIGITAT